jgi:hypothetical protein
MLNLFDECDAAKVHVIVFLFQGTLVIDTIWIIPIWIVDKLTCSEQKGQMLVVIESPDAMGTCWFQKVCKLDLSHKFYISLEYFVDQRLVIIIGVDADFAETIQKHKKVELMSRSIIYSLIRAKTFQQITLQFWNGSLIVRKIWISSLHDDGEVIIN